MHIKKLILITVTGFSLSLLSGCASSSFHEYFNEPVTVVEKSTQLESVSEIKSDIVKEQPDKDTSVETYPVLEIK